MTLNQLIVIFRYIATRHKQVHSFKVAQDFNIDAEEALRFPCLVINPITSQLPKTDNGYSIYSVTFDIQLLDLMNKDRDNEDDVISDNLTILREIVNEFNTHPYYMDSGIDLVGNISFTTIRGAYDSDVTGWRCTMEMQSPNRLSFCGSPIENLTGYDFSAAAVTVNDGADTYELYPSDTYTCLGGITPSGIAYQRPQPTLQTTSYATYDDAWQLANGGYNFNYPTNPLYTQQLDLVTDNTGYTLLYNNAFGNKFRFTNIDGSEATSSDFTYIIDNLSGIAWSYLGGSRYSYNNVFGIGGELETLNTGGHSCFNDYFVPSATMVTQIQQLDAYVSGRTLLLPFMVNSLYEILTSTTYNFSSSSVYQSTRFVFITAISKASNSSFLNFYCRKHF